VFNAILMQLTRLRDNVVANKLLNWISNIVSKKSCPCKLQIQQIYWKA